MQDPNQQIHQLKASAMRSLMGHKTMGPTVLAALNSPYGSAKRSTAARHLGVVDMAVRNHVSKNPPRFDGQGGDGYAGVSPDLGSTSAGSAQSAPDPTTHTNVIPTFDIAQPPASSDASANPLSDAQQGAPSGKLVRDAATGGYKVVPYTMNSSGQMMDQNGNIVGGAAAQVKPASPGSYIPSYTSDITAPGAGSMDYGSLSASSPLFAQLPAGPASLKSATPSKSSEFSTSNGIPVVSGENAPSGSGGLVLPASAYARGSSAVPPPPGTASLSMLHDYARSLGISDEQFSNIATALGNDPVKLSARLTAWDKAKTNPINQGSATAPVTGQEKAGTPGANQLQINAVAQLKHDELVSQGVDDVSAWQQANDWVKTNYKGASATNDGINSGSTSGQTLWDAMIAKANDPLSKRTAAQWWANLGPQGQANPFNAQLWAAYNSNLGGDAFSQDMLKDPAIVASVTGLDPAVVKQWPIDAFGGPNVQAITDTIRQRDGIYAIEDRLNSGQIQSNLAGDIGRQYLKSVDAYGNKLDGMLKNWDKASAYADTSDPTVARTRALYRNYLVSLGTDQIQRTNAILTDSVAATQQEYSSYSTMAAAQIAAAQDEATNQISFDTNIYNALKARFKASYDALDGMDKAVSDEMTNKVNLLTNAYNMKLLPTQMELQRVTAGYNARIMQNQLNAATTSGLTGNEKPFSEQDYDNFYWGSGGKPKTFSKGSYAGNLEQLSPEDIDNYTRSHLMASSGTPMAKEARDVYAQDLETHFSAGGKGTGVATEFDNFVNKLASQTVHDKAADAQFLTAALSGAGKSISTDYDAKDPNGAIAAAFAKDYKWGHNDAWFHNAYDGKLGKDFVTAMLAHPDALQSNSDPASAFKGAALYDLHQKASSYLSGIPDSPKANSPVGSTAGAGGVQGDPLSQLDLGNGSLHNAFASVAPTGSAQGECGHFVNTINKELGSSIPHVGDSLASKIAVINKNITADTVQPGDVFVMNVGNPENGHIGFVNAVLNYNGRKVLVLSESNYHEDLKVTHDRMVYADDPTILGFAR